MKKSPKIDKFVFLSERSIRKEKIEFTRHQSADLRQKTQKGIYHLQLTESGSIFWNWTLLQSYLIHGADSPITKSLEEEYIASLPQSA
jgi:hypothetical protein